jgi:hypothetical protein
MELRWVICVALGRLVVLEKKNAAIVSLDLVGEVRRVQGAAPWVRRV